MVSQIIKPSAYFKHDNLRVPGDKSISHRAIIFASLAEGVSKIRGLLLGEDVLCTMRIFQQMGVKMSHLPENLKPEDELIVEGVGLHGLKAPKEILYCGNSGTTMRLMLGLLSVQEFEATLTGDASLNKRPMDRVINELENASHFSKPFLDEQGRRLIRINPGKKSLDKKVSKTLKIASAQVKTALLLQGLYLKEGITIVEPGFSRDHSEQMLVRMGVAIQSVPDGSIGKKVYLAGNQKIKPFDMNIPGDFSSAAFFIVGALIHPQGDICLQNIGLNPTRTGLLEILMEQMGAKITYQQDAIGSIEPQGKIRVESSKLTPCKVDGPIIPRLIDEIPILAVAATQAVGMSQIRDAQELRVKESDRIEQVVSFLKLMGGDVSSVEDGFDVKGPFPLQGISFHSHGDHRIAMSLAIAGLIAQDPIIIDEFESVQTSFPSFLSLYKNCTKGA